jgi:PDDEXK-like domain of unknown function (DUF3799)
MQPVWKEWDGKPIRFPGLYKGVPMAVYHGKDLCIEPSVSASAIRTALKDSLAHYWDQCAYNEKGEPREDTKPMALGRAAHHVLLGDKEEDCYVMRPKMLNNIAWQSNRLDCKAWVEQQEAAGRTIVTDNDVDRIKGMARALRKHPLVGGRSGAPPILDGLIEMTMVWKDLKTGLWCKARPDAVPTDGSQFGDLKTCQSVSDDAIRRAMDDRWYHLWAAFLSFGCEIVLGFKLDLYVLVFVESDRPYCVRTVPISIEDVTLGREQVRFGLNRLAACFKSGDWPGPGMWQGAGDDKADDIVREFRMSDWERGRIERALGKPLTR